MRGAYLKRQRSGKSVRGGLVGYLAYGLLAAIVVAAALGLMGGGL